MSTRPSSLTTSITIAPSALSKCHRRKHIIGASPWAENSTTTSSARNRKKKGFPFITKTNSILSKLRCGDGHVPSEKSTQPWLSSEISTDFCPRYRPNLVRNIERNCVPNMDRFFVRNIVGNISRHIVVSEISSYFFLSWHGSTW